MIITRPLSKHGIDHRLVKLGRLPYRHDRRNLQLVKYLPRALPAAPDAYDWLSKASPFGPMGNLSVGDCTCAGAGHLIQMWTANQGRKTVLPDADILAVYSKLSGYVPGNPSTDNGAAIQDVLNYWRTRGVAGHKCLAFAQVNPLNRTEFCQAVDLFGSVDMGSEIPQSAVDQFDAGQPWDVVANDGGIVGGHSYECVGYNSTGPLYVTWGKVVQATWAWHDKYLAPGDGGEAWVVITPEWFNAQGNDPQGIDTVALGADFTAMTGDPSPFPAPSPNPAPTPTPSPSGSGCATAMIALAALAILLILR